MGWLLLPAGDHEDERRPLRGALPRDRALQALVGGERVLPGVRAEVLRRQEPRHASLSAHRRRAEPRLEGPGASRPMTKIALMVPVTSRGRHFESVLETDFLRTLLPSFLQTATWDGTQYRFYLGYDKGDPFYDDPSVKGALTQAFESVVPGKPAELVLSACEGTEHAPAWAWNQIFEQAYKDGSDFFYQVGDDIELLSPGWASAFPE